MMLMFVHLGSKPPWFPEDLGGRLFLTSFGFCVNQQNLPQIQGEKTYPQEFLCLIACSVIWDLFLLVWGFLLLLFIGFYLGSYISSSLELHFEYILQRCWIWLMRDNNSLFLLRELFKVCRGLEGPLRDILPMLHLAKMLTLGCKGT